MNGAQVENGRRGATRGRRRPVSARGLAIEALLAVDGGERANVALPQLLATCHLPERDRAFVTNLVYGTVRMRRACDWLVDQNLRRPVTPAVRAVLRLGAFQLLVLRTPSHAAVSATVAEVDGAARGLVNAVLRRVAEQLAAAPDAESIVWPSLPVRLSYPDWIVVELSAALGTDQALGALEQMNQPAEVTLRPDGYVQDRASQWVTEAFLATGTGAGSEGTRVIDLCAAPGGKATWLASGCGGTRPALDLVVAGEIDHDRVAVVAANARTLGIADRLSAVVLDGRHPPFPPATFDRVLVDAPCSGLGVLRRRPDARWRVQPDDVRRLAGLQRRLLEEALVLARPGGLVAYSVCTLTEQETAGIDRWLASAHPQARAVAPAVGESWARFGRGVRLLPQAAGTDGMFLLLVRRPG